MTQKKDILEALLMHEISMPEQILEVLEKMQLIAPTKDGVFYDSHAWCWLENNPSQAEKKKVLTALGYDVSKL